jgi:hypothetical protein
VLCFNKSSLLSLGHNLDPKLLCFEVPLEPKALQEILSLLFRLSKSPSLCLFVCKSLLVLIYFNVISSETKGLLLYLNYLFYLLDLIYLIYFFNKLVSLSLALFQCPLFYYRLILLFLFIIIFLSEYLPSNKKLS